MIFIGILFTDRLRSFTIGLTDHDPQNGVSPLDSPFVKCASHGAMGDVLTVDIMCETPIDATGRYLFVAANVVDFFSLGEVEVLDGKMIKLPIKLLRYSPFKQFIYECIYYI